MSMGNVAVWLHPRKGRSELDVKVPRVLCGMSSCGRGGEGVYDACHGGMNKVTKLVSTQWVWQGTTNKIGFYAKYSPSIS